MYEEDQEKNRAFIQHSQVEEQTEPTQPTESGGKKASITDTVLAGKQGTTWVQGQLCYRNRLDHMGPVEQDRRHDGWEVCVGQCRPLRDARGSTIPTGQLEGDGDGDDIEARRGPCESFLFLFLPSAQLHGTQR